MEAQWKHRGRQYVPARKKARTIRLAILVGVVLFILVNLLIWAVYRNRTYPGTTVMGAHIGSVAYGNLVQKVDNSKLLPASITLQYHDQKAVVALGDLGIAKDGARTSTSADDKKLLLPIANFFTSPELAAPITIDSQVLSTKAAELATIFQGEATDARIKLQGTTFSVVPAQDKYRLDDTRLQSFIIEGMDSGKKVISVPVKTTPAAVSSASLDKDAQDLQQQLDTVVTITYNGKAQRPSKATIASWYTPSGNTYAASLDSIIIYLNSLTKAAGYTKDAQSVGSNIQKALKTHKAYSTTITSVAPSKAFSYCTAVKGVAQSELPILRSKLESTYGDSRGWSLNGLVAFKPATTGCDFTVWLSAADLMPTFGAICDSMWSCRVGPNVVINYDRWQNASPAWNNYGGTLQEYRYMVINHETGHWLGFDHDHCPGAGMQAPVMQQQSIDLQGCSFSPWPNVGEKAEVRTRFNF